jgi:hypothetical protein
MAPVHKLPDFSRSQANTTAMATTMTVKHVSPYQLGVPEL